MTYEDYQSVRDFIYDRSLRLMSHEKKNFAKAGFPWQNYSYLYIQGKYYYIAKTNPFKIIIDEVLVEAVNKFPKNFGTGCAKDVIEAIYKIDPVFFLSMHLLIFCKQNNFAI